MASKDQFHLRREGVSWPVAGWVRTLTLASRQAIFANKLNAPFPRRHLTKVRYTAEWANASDLERA